MDEHAKPDDEKRYRGIIGSILYLTANRTNIVYSIRVCDRFQSSPKESYMKVVKRILKYLKGSQDLALWYPRSGRCELVRFVDANYASYVILECPISLVFA